jgi:hypothetical protein
MIGAADADAGAAIAPSAASVAMTLPPRCIVAVLKQSDGAQVSVGARRMHCAKMWFRRARE